MLDFQNTKMKLRTDYEKMHRRLDNHQVFIEAGNKLVEFWGTGQAAIDERQSGIKFIQAGVQYCTYANVDIDLWLRKVDSKLDVVEALKFLYSICPQLRGFKRETTVPRPGCMYWIYEWFMDKGRVFPDHDRYLQVKLCFHINTDGLCKRVKVGTEVKTEDIYEWQCQEIPA